MLIHCFPALAVIIKPVYVYFGVWCTLCDAYELLLEAVATGSVSIVLSGFMSTLYCTKNNDSC